MWGTVLAFGSLQKTINTLAKGTVENLLAILLQTIYTKNAYEVSHRQK